MQGPQPGATERYYLRHPQARLMVLMIVCLSAFLTPLSLSAILVAVPAISRGLQADAIYSSWIPAAFLLSNLSALLPAGRLADLYGRKRIFLLGNLVYATACVLAGLSTTVEFLLLMRVLQGIGAAMFFSTGMAILSSVYRSVGRGAALGWMVAAVYLGLSSGPLIGGWAVDRWDWHAVFYIQVPLALMNILAGVRMMRGEWRSDEPHAVDWTGVVLLATGITLLFLGLTNVYQTWGQVTSLLSAGILFVFVHHSRKTAYPLVHIPLLQENKTFSRAVSASIFMYSGQYGLVFLMGLYLQYNRGLSPGEAGQLLMLQAIVMALCAPVAGRLSDTLGARILATLGCIIIACGQLVLAFVSVDMSMLMIVLALMTIGLGHGLFSTPNNSTALGTIAEQRMGIASAMLNQSRLIGQLSGTMLVSFLMSWHLGNVVIGAQHLDKLQLLTRQVVGCSVVFALLGAFFSARSPE